MPAAPLRIRPARSMSLWLSTSASAGTSRSVGASSDDIFIQDPFLLFYGEPVHGELAVFEYSVIVIAQPVARIDIGFSVKIGQIGIVGMGDNNGVEIFFFKENLSSRAVFGLHFLSIFRIAYKSSAQRGYFLCKIEAKGGMDEPVEACIQTAAEKAFENDLGYDPIQEPI